MTNPPSPVSTRRRIAARASHHLVPHPRRGQRALPAPASAGAPDLAAAAGEAVVRFLHESAVAVAEHEGGWLPDGTPAAQVAEAMPWSAAAGTSQLSAESVALKAAAVSVATLDRIELLAAKLEADIASAHRAQAELQAGAGAAAAAAVRAAQDAWVAAGTAVEADQRAKISLVKIARYTEITFALVLVAMIILVVTATSAH